VDTRHTFFQAPVKVEDALGRIWPVPSEYSVDDLHAIIRRKFVDQPGHAEIEAGNYEIFNQENGLQTISTGRDIILVPGMSVVMALLVKSIAGGGSLCPLPICASDNTVVVTGGGRKW
jgi:hypothetical protein